MCSDVSGKEKVRERILWRYDVQAHRGIKGENSDMRSGIEG